MKIYLVGGAIRDELLGIPYDEKDWLVVNSSHKEMIKQGFKQVGKNFPVYLHPKTKEEYALARKESKTGKGHKKFSFYIKSDVTLKEDLKRRDITINAIAKDESGKLYDPFGGIKDLKNRKIRIVSKAFSEDPLRLFRVARLKSKLADFNFSISRDTLKVLKVMSSNGEINFLSGERIWDETYKALSYKNSSKYFSLGSFDEAYPCLYRPLCSRNRIGSSILQADLRRPFASYGVDGRTTLSPGMWLSQT